MAKSLRSKIQRRWRSLRRSHIDTAVCKAQETKITDSLNAVMCGQEYREKEYKNAFLHPEDAESKFPQRTPAPMIDLRSSSIAGAGREWSGANRKSLNRTVT